MDKHGLKRLDGAKAGLDVDKRGQQGSTGSA